MAQPRRETGRLPCSGNVTIPINGAGPERIAAGLRANDLSVGPIGSPFAGRGCMWITNFGDMLHIYEVPDTAAFRMLAATLEHVPVGEVGWIESEFQDIDVFFRVGDQVLGAHVGMHALDRDEAILFALDVAAVARGQPPACC